MIIRATGSMRGWLVLLLLCTVGTVARAQVTDLDRSNYGTAAAYDFTEPGDVTMLVSVWGAVSNPGLYRIPRNTPVSRLLSLAGGPSVGQRRRREVRTVQLRLFRRGMRGPIYEVKMKNEIVAGDRDPLLQDGDVLAVESVVKERFGFRDIFPIIAAAASVSLIVERLVNPN